MRGLESPVQVSDNTLGGGHVMFKKNILLTFAVLPMVQAQAYALAKTFMSGTAGRDTQEKCKESLPGGSPFAFYCLLSSFLHRLFATYRASSRAQQHAHNE